MRRRGGLVAATGSDTGGHRGGRGCDGRESAWADLAGVGAGAVKGSGGLMMINFSGLGRLASACQNTSLENRITLRPPAPSEQYGMPERFLFPVQSLRALASIAPLLQLLSEAGVEMVPVLLTERSAASLTPSACAEYRAEGSASSSRRSKSPPSFLDSSMVTQAGAGVDSGPSY